MTALGIGTMIMVIGIIAAVFHLTKDEGIMKDRRDEETKEE